MTCSFFFTWIRCAKQHVHDAKMDPADFRGIVVDQPHRFGVERSLDNQLLTDFPLDGCFKRLQAHSKQRMVFCR